MKIIVFDVAAESGGALTILDKYYNEAFLRANEEWHFILSVPEFDSKDNVVIHNYPWIKKNWFFRLYFDFFIAPGLVKKLNGDIVFSLQNIIIPFINTKQIVYFHQVLPFSKKKFSILKNPKFWIYQNIIGKLIIHSFRKANKIIVQSHWIKRMFVLDFNIPEDKMIVEYPELNIENLNKFESAKSNNKVTYFYPASADIYKNHQLVIDVTIKLIEKDISDFEVLFTLTGNENKTIAELKNIVQANKLPIKFIGQIPITEVYELYSKSILLFPSYIESYALPLEEAKFFNTPVIAADLEYARETLSNYEKAIFFDPFNIDDLYLLMKNKVASNF